MTISTTAAQLVPLYTTSEKILIATSSFSLTVSVVTELLLFYILHRGSVKVCFIPTFSSNGSLRSLSVASHSNADKFPLRVDQITTALAAACRPVG